MTVRGATKFREVTERNNSRRGSGAPRGNQARGRGLLPEPRAGGAARFPSK